MKRRVLIASCLFAMILGAGGCSMLNRKFGLSDDNFIEESAEMLLEEHLGIEVDLSAQSPEN